MPSSVSPAVDAPIWGAGPDVVRPKALVQYKRNPQLFGVILRWPADRLDWEPLGDDSDEWVVLWFDFDRAGQKVSHDSELVCAGEFRVIGYLDDLAMSPRSD